MISIDPGKTGAMVRWYDDQPVTWIQFDEKERFFGYDTVVLIEGMYEFVNITHVVIEALMDKHIGKQSSVANNTTAANWGIHYGMAQWYGADIRIVHPSAWKTRLKLTRDKALSMEMAKDLYPICAPSLTLKKNHDLAEALLIGHDFINQRNNNG